MRHHHFPMQYVVVFILVAGLTVLSACKRAPKEDVTTQPTPAAENLPPIVGLDLPQSHPEIGITLAGAPSNLVATYNGEHWIELTDKNRRTLRYTFASSPEYVAGIGVANIDDFESEILNADDGTFLDQGVIDTALGKAVWASGSFSQDGETIEEVFVLVPRPSGDGDLVLASTCPRGVATVDERLNVIAQILEHVT